MDPIDVDWDKFEAEGRELAARMRAVSAEMQRQNAISRASRSGGSSVAREQPPPYQTWENRLDKLERMLADTLSAVTVLQHDVGGLKADVSGLKADVTDIRERMATKVELESFRESINMVADGFAQTQARLESVGGLLKRYLTA